MGRINAETNNFDSCQRCEDGTYTKRRGAASCKQCAGWMFAFETSRENKQCRASPWTNLLGVSMVSCWGLIFWTLAFICGLPGVVTDIRLSAGQVHVFSSGRHLLLRRSRPVRLRFWGTGVPGLDSGSLMDGGPRQWLKSCCHRKKIVQHWPYKVRHVSAMELSLCNADGEPITDAKDASIGYFQVLPRHAMASLGFLRVPLLLWMIIPLVLYLALMVIFASRFFRVSVAVLLHALVGKHRPKPCPRGPSRAVTARQLQDFVSYFQAYTGYRTTYYVAHNILKPITEPYQLSYAEVAGPSTVRWFVSHFWGTPFVHLVSTVTKHAEEAAAEDPSWVSPANSQSYWICTFSNNQSDPESIHEELGGGDWSISSFYMALHSPTTIGTAMVFDDEAMPLTRSWCLFELLQTTILKKARGKTYRGLKLCSPLGIMNNGSGSMDLALNVSRKLAHLRLQDAQASVQSDKEMIENLVIAEGGFDLVNLTLIESVREVLQAVQYSFTRTMQNLETDLAQRGANRARTLPGFAQGRSYTASFALPVTTARTTSGEDLPLLQEDAAQRI
eukprot:s5053_g2.t3